MQATSGGRKYATRCPFTGAAMHTCVRAVAPQTQQLLAASCGAGASALTLTLPSAELDCAGYKPTLRCPSCDARVHDSAFHKTDRLVG